MPDLAELTLVIKSEQAAKAATDLVALERASASAERSSTNLQRGFEQTERAATGLDRVYNRLRDSLGTLNSAQQQVERQGTLATTSALNLGAAVGTASEQFDRFGIVDLDPIRDQLEFAEEGASRLRERALAAGEGVSELNDATLDNLEESVLEARNAFDALESRAVSSGERIQQEAENIIRAYNLAGQRISQSFESGVDLSLDERVDGIRREAERRREVTTAISAQLSELGRLGVAEQAEIERAYALTAQYEEQSVARLRDAEAARAQIEASRPSISSQFESGVELDFEEKIQGIEQEVGRRRDVIATIEAQLIATGRLGVVEQEEIARSRELTDRFQAQSTARLRDEEAARKQAAANAALSGTYSTLLGHARTLVAAFVAFISVREATTAILGVDAAESSLRGTVEETTRGLDEQDKVFGELNTSAREFGLTTQFNSTQVTAAYQQMIKAGFDAKDSILGVAAAANLAEAENLSMAQSVDLVTRALKQYNLDGSQAERITDSLVTVSNRVQGDVSELAAGFNQVGPSVAAANVRMSETIAILGTLSQLRGRGQQGPQVVRALINELIDPSEKAVAVFEQLNLKMEQLDPRLNSITSILERLKGANFGAAEAMEAFNRNTALGITFLVQNAGRVRELTEEQERGVGVTQRLADANSNNLKGSFEELQSAFNTFVGSQSGVARGFKGIVDTAADTIRVLSGVNDPLAEANDSAQAFASSLRVLSSTPALIVGGISLLTGAVQLYRTTALAAKFETLGLFGVMAAHPFATVAIALTTLTVGFKVLRPEVVSTREEMEKIGDAIDVDRVQRFAKGIDQLTASLIRAREQGNLRRQVEATRGILDELNAQADFIAQQQRAFGGAASVPVLDEEAKFDLERTLKSIEDTLGIQVRVDFETTVLEREARTVGDRMRDLIIGELRNTGDIKVRQGLLGFGAPIGVRSNSEAFDETARQNLLEKVVPPGRVSLPGVSSESSQELADSLGEVSRKYGAELSKAWREGNASALAQIVADINDDLDPVVLKFISSQKLISVSADNIRGAFEDQIKGVEAELTVLEKRASEVKPSIGEGGGSETEEGGQVASSLEARLREAERLQEAREQLKEYVVTKREELAQLQAVSGLTGETAQRYSELAQAQQLFSAAGLETTETQKAFADETDRLLRLLDAGFKDPEQLEAFRGEFGKLLLLIEETKRAQTGFSQAPETSSPASPSSLSNAPLEDVATARLLQADAVLGQDVAVQSLIKTLRQEREDLERTTGLTEADTEAVLNLARAERLIEDSTQLSSESRREYLSLAEEEVQRLRQVQVEQESVRTARGEERRVIDDVISSRLSELEVYASGRRTIQEYLTTLAEERQLRQQTVGLSDEEASQLNKLIQLERLLASTVGLTGEEREAAIELAREELRALLALGPARIAANAAQDQRTVTRADTLVAVRQQEDENERIRDTLKFLDARTDAQRDEIVLAAARRNLKPYEDDLSTLEELQRRQEAALRTQRELNDELENRSATRQTITSRVQAAEGQRVSLEDETAFIEARTDAERQALVLTQAARRERYTAAELEKKSVEELKDLYIELANSVETATTKRTVVGAKRQLEEEIRFSKLPQEEQQLEGRLRGLDPEQIAESKDEIRGLLREANRIREFEFIGRSMARTFTDAFEAIAFEGAKLPDLMAGIARRILDSFLEVFLNKPLENIFANLFANFGSSLFGGGGGSPVGFEGLPEQKAKGDVFAFRQGAAIAYGDEPGFAQEMPTVVRALASGGAFPRGPSRYIDTIATRPTLEDSDRLVGSAIVPLSGGGVATPDGEKLPVERRGGELVVVRAFARGGVTALFGEAGDEAIMRLYRTSDGQPGIRAEDGEVLPLQRVSGGRLGVVPFALGGVPDESRAISTQVEPFALGGVADDSRSVGTRVDSFALGSALDMHRGLRTDVEPFALGGAPGLEQTLRTRVEPFALGGVSDATRSIRTEVEPFALGGVPGLGRALETRVAAFAAGGAPDMERTLRTAVVPYAQGGEFAFDRAVAAPSVAPSIVDALAGRGEDRVALRLGGAFPEPRFQPLELGQLFPPTSAGAESGVPQPFAVVAGTTNNGNSTDTTKSENYQFVSHYHFHGNATPDSGFKRSARHHEQDLRDRSRNVLRGRNG